MVPGEAGAFAALMAELGEVYREDVSEIRARLYFDALVDLPIAVLRRAVADLIKASRFFPKPADLREAVASRAERPTERPALYPHIEPIDPALFKRLLAETVAKLDGR